MHALTFIYSFKYKRSRRDHAEIMPELNAHANYKFSFSTFSVNEYWTPQVTFIQQISIIETPPWQKSRFTFSFPTAVIPNTENPHAPPTRSIHIALIESEFYLYFLFCLVPQKSKEKICNLKRKLMNAGYYSFHYESEFITCIYTNV